MTGTTIQAPFDFLQKQDNQLPALAQAPEGEACRLPQRARRAEGKPERSEGELQVMSDPTNV